MSKIRITRYQTDMSLISDRLVESATEFATGPGEVHTEGPVRIDYLMESKEEVDGLLNYLQQLVGLMPITEKPLKVTKSVKPLEKTSLDQLVADAIKKNKDQESLLEYLRGLNFVMVTYDHWLDICQKNNWDWKPKLHKETKKPLFTNYQVMVRQLRVAKDPANDKYDPSVVFLIRLIGERVPTFKVFEALRFRQSVEMPWAEQGEVNFKEKQKFYKFPAIMSYEERSKWRLEDRKVQFTPGYTPTSLYNKYKEHVKILSPLKK